MSVFDAWRCSEAFECPEVGVFLHGVTAVRLPPHASRLLIVRPAPVQARLGARDRGLREARGEDGGAGLSTALGRAGAGVAGAACLLLFCFLRWARAVREIKRAR
jgi:hypothetical protein